MDILRKEYCTRRGRALEAFPTRAKSRGRPVTSDRPPPRRCGQAAWAAAGRPMFATNHVLPPNGHGKQPCSRACGWSSCSSCVPSNTHAGSRQHRVFGEPRNVSQRSPASLQSAALLCSAPCAGMMHHCRAFLGDDRDVDGAVERWKARLLTLRAQAYSRINVEFDCTIRVLQGLFAQRA